MARRAVALGLPRLPGLLAGGVVLALTLVLVLVQVVELLLLV